MKSYADMTYEERFAEAKKISDWIKNVYKKIEEGVDIEANNAKVKKFTNFITEMSSATSFGKSIPCEPYFEPKIGQWLSTKQEPEDKYIAMRAEIFDRYWQNEDLS